MNDYTEVSKLMEDHHRASKKAAEYETLARIRLEEARSRCAHPARKKETKPREDEYGKTVGYDHEATCLICGHVETDSD